MLVALTAVNAVIVLVAGYGAIHSMESPSFCGQTCHTPMHPQFTAWQGAPHSEVACVQCHIGEGGHAFVKYKMNGMRQLYHVVTGHYPATDSRRRRSASRASRCARRVIGRAKDLAMSSASSGNTPTTRRTPRRRRSFRCSWAALARRRPAAAPSTGTPIHACASSSSSPTGSARPFRSSSTRTRRGASASTPLRAQRRSSSRRAPGARWTASTATTFLAHRVAPTPEQAVDTAIAAGRIDRGLPFVRREGVRLMKSTYQTSDEAARVVDEDLRKFYTSRGRAVDAQVTGAVTALQDIYRRNVFPSDESHVRHLSRQRRPHDVVGVFSLPRWQAHGEGRQLDQLGLRGTATNRSTTRVGDLVPSECHARRSSWIHRIQEIPNWTSLELAPGL